MHNSYIRQRDYKRYDSSISIRINPQFYSFLYKIKPRCVSGLIRSLIRVEIYGGYIEINNRDAVKMFKCFSSDERQLIQDFNFRSRKSQPLIIKCYETEKQEIKKLSSKRSNGNISNYIDILIMSFINQIMEQHIMEGEGATNEGYI